MVFIHISLFALPKRDGIVKGRPAANRKSVPAGPPPGVGGVKIGGGAGGDGKGRGGAAGAKGKGRFDLFENLLLADDCVDSS